MASIKLSESEVNERLSGLDNWKLSGDVISKTFVFGNFIQSMEFVNQLAETAEEVQHHPDIDIRYDHVTVALTTHDADGLTGSDFDLAAEADEFALITTAELPA